MEEKMRTFELDGKKRGIRLDAYTWQAVDRLAANAGVKWAVLARQWADADPKGVEENLTSAIRAGVMAGMLAPQKANATATANARATTTPGIIRIDWKTEIAHGDFQLNEKEIKNLINSIEYAKVEMMVIECPEVETERLETLTKLAGKLLLKQANPHLF